VESTVQYNELAIDQDQVRKTFLLKEVEKRKIPSFVEEFTS